MENKDIIKELTAIIRRHLPDRKFKILLFGSWAKGSAEPTSDIDVGILGPQPVDDPLLLRIREEILGIPTLRRIDLVDLNQTDQRFRQEVMSYAQTL
ncbi:MAG: nucleotidyltransferase domain-containing protein [Candidatus Liptonbacteria bacterium]|nr:nucleotidyltransferase domain-containing protein [Candidatus Liptonbacteria bacterium]